MLNDGKGKFSDVTNQWLGNVQSIGMITDAKWCDMNKDKRPDLVMAGEWMAPRVLLNTGKQLQVAEVGLQAYKGRWNTVELFDGTMTVIWI